MHYNLKNYTDDEVYAVLESADIETAIELWKLKDWRMYSETCQVLLALLRSGHQDQVERRHVQFMYFITTHLYPRAFHLSGRQLFKADLPQMDARQQAAWERASSDLLWDDEL